MKSDEVNMRKFLIKKWLEKSDFFWEARSRIFAWYVGLSAITVGLAIPVFTQLAILQVDLRVREDIREEIEAFHKAANKYGEKDVATIFDRFLENEIPADKTFLIATIDGKFYNSSPVSLPQTLDPESPLVKKLARRKQSLRGKNLIKDPELGNILYKAEPIAIDEQVSGVLIIGTIAKGERQEVLAAMIVAIEVLLVALILALILAWVIAGGVLKPISTLRNTANSISETDLSKRIPIRGRGEMAELAKTFNNMMTRLETAFQSQRQFLNDASHELRTPITIIRGHLELLEYDDPQDIEETIPLVLDELDRMGRFVEDLLLLAKAERRDFLILESVNLFELTTEMYLKMRGLGERQWQLDSQEQGTITVDRQRISQAMMNLADNAVQHTKKADTIAIGSAIENEQIRLWVRDTGIGIPPQDQERIFERFTRSSNNQHASQGAGLGLSIVSAIAKSHGGRVELYSQLEKGSIFTIVLPRNNP